MDITEKLDAEFEKFYSKIPQEVRRGLIKEETFRGLIKTAYKAGANMTLGICIDKLTKR